MVTGFLDDWLGMDALVKLGGQIAAGGLLFYYGVSLRSLPLPESMGGNVFLDLNLQAVMTILVVVVAINAVNFVDGLDGLAAGIVGIAALATLVYSIGSVAGPAADPHQPDRRGRGAAGRYVPGLPAPQLQPGQDLHG